MEMWMHGYMDIWICWYMEMVIYGYMGNVNMLKYCIWVYEYISTWT